MRTALSLSILGFLFLVVPLQTMAGSAPPSARCGTPYYYPNHLLSVCTGSLDGCPVGTHEVICTGGNCNGTDGNDCIIGTNGSDIINAGKGNDWICGYGGADWIKASYGRDVACGGDGNDVMEGGWGSDDMNGGSDADTLDGGQCDDNALYGGADSGDVCRGGLGNDSLDGSCELASQGPIASQSGVNCPPPPP